LNSQALESNLDSGYMVKPHLSLNIEALETPIQAFQRKLPLEKAEAI